MFEVNLNAPRFRKSSKSLLDKKLYDKFIEKYPQYKDVDYNTFKSIIKNFNIEFTNAVLTHRTGVSLPQDLGTILVGSYKKRSPVPTIDFGLSLKYKTKIEARSLSTEDLSCKIFYTNYKVKLKLKNSRFWKFIPHRDFKRKVSKDFSENYNNYIYVQPNIKISSLFEK